MRVAVVLPELDAESGGGFTFQESVAAALDRVGDGSRHEFVVYSHSGAGRNAVRLPAGRRALAARRAVRVGREIQERGLGIRPVSGSTWFERSLGEHAIDLVWFGTPKAEDCGDRPYIFTVWDLQYLEQPWFPEVSAGGEWELRHAFHTRYVPRATRVIVPNAAGREQLLRHFPVGEDRVLTLPHPTPEFALNAAEDGGLTPGVEAPYLLYPAQYWPHKNHATLLAALAELPGYRLACVGSDKGYLDHVKRLAREAGVLDRVSFLGFVDTDRLVALYRGAHALVYLSWFGPENLPPLEAGALGCPVVQSDVPGARDQLGDAALFVPPADATAVIDAVRSLESEETRAELVGRGRERAASLTSDGYVRGVLEFLDEFEAVRRSWP